MLYRLYEQGDVEGVVELWNATAKELSYKPFASSAAFVSWFCTDPNYLPQGMMVAVEGDRVIGCVLAIRKTELLPDEDDAALPGFISFLIVGQGYRGRGVGSRLLAMAEDYLKQTGRPAVRFSHKCPIKLSWYVNSRGHEHNKAPGVMTDSQGMNFLTHHGYTDVQHEVSYYLDLAQLVVPDKVMGQIKATNSSGFHTAFFDPSKHYGHEEMFERLRDESFLQKFRDGIEKGKRLLVVVDPTGKVCGSAGTIFREEVGRGFFSALAVDPACSGNGIGTMLFFDLCSQLKELGADYMTLFVTSTNFAHKIYEKAGFAVVKEWAILEKIF